MAAARARSTRDSARPGRAMRRRVGGAAPSTCAGSADADDARRGASRVPRDRAATASRVMPFLEGIPCSIHGFVLDGPCHRVPSGRDADAAPSGREPIALRRHRDVLGSAGRRPRRRCETPHAHSARMLREQVGYRGGVHARWRHDVGGFPSDRIELARRRRTRTHRSRERRQPRAHQFAHDHPVRISTSARRSSRRYVVSRADEDALRRLLLDLPEAHRRDNDAQGRRRLDGTRSVRPVIGGFLRFDPNASRGAAWPVVRTHRRPGVRVHRRRRSIPASAPSKPHARSADPAQLNRSCVSARSAGSFAHEDRRSGLRDPGRIERRRHLDDVERDDVEIARAPRPPRAARRTAAPRAPGCRSPARTDGSSTSMSSVT